MTRSIHWAALVCGLLFFHSPAISAESADTIYHGGTIVPMTGEHARAEALAVKDGRILRVGKLADVMALQGDATAVVDLEGRCLMPGFVNAYSSLGSQFATGPVLPPAEARALMAANLEACAAAGITTALDVAISSGTTVVLADMNEAGLIPLDVVTYPNGYKPEDAAMNSTTADRTSRSRLRQGGVAFYLDNSIVKLHAFMTEPYLTWPNRVNSSAASELQTKMPHRGFSLNRDDQVLKVVSACDAVGIQILAQANGDASIDRLLESLSTLRAAAPRPDLRTVIVGAAAIREDQLDAAVKQGITLSFSPMVIEQNGDKLRDDDLGIERAKRLYPAKSALDRATTFTLHCEIPSGTPHMLAVAAEAVLRRTGRGLVLGPEQRIPPYDALRAITINAAWQCFEEGRKGTLEAGKLADMVILDADPLATEPLAWADIAVMETIKEGETIYRNEAAPVVDLKGTMWQVDDMSGTGVLDETNLIVGIDPAGRVSGSAGCNQIMGAAQIDGAAIQFKPLATTRRMCSRELMEQEQLFLKALNSARSYEVDSLGLLHFYDEAGDEVMRLIKMEK